MSPEPWTRNPEPGGFSLSLHQYVYDLLQKLSIKLNGTVETSNKIHLPQAHGPEVRPERVNRTWNETAIPTGKQLQSTTTLLNNEI
jgi:hypothetical protein